MATVTTSRRHRPRLFPHRRATRRHDQLVTRVHEPRAQDAIRRFGLEDTHGRSLGVFVTRCHGWRVGDWILGEDGRRLRIAVIVPAGDGGHESWVVEPA